MAGAKKPGIDHEYACFPLEVRRSPIHRWGVFAAAGIPARRKVIEYTGELVSRKEAKRRGNGPHVYLFELDSYWARDGAVRGSGAEYINHSCEPNLKSIILRGHILFMSLREIRAGEELTIHYNLSRTSGPVACGCGSKQCSGVMNAPEEPRRKRRSRAKARTD
jgi:uncharacterized protein